MKKKLFALFTAAAVAALCVPVLCACNPGAGYTLKTDEDGNKYYVASCQGSPASLSGELVIEEYYGEGENRFPVTEIAETGFSGTNVTKVTIPATVKKIGVAAFAYNSLLREVEFGEGTEIEEISRGAFGYCNSLRAVSVPESVRIIGNMCFYGCNLLSEVNLSAVEKIGERAFEDCYSLENIVLPETLVTIGERAFCYSALKEIIIPDGVTATADGGNEVPAIGYAAFHSCTALERAVVGSGVTELKSGVFGYCTSLKEIYIPETVVKIEGAHYKDEVFYCGHAFHNDTALTDVYYGGTAEGWSALAANTDNERVTESGSSFDNSALLNAALHTQSPYIK